METEDIEKRLGYAYLRDTVRERPISPEESIKLLECYLAEIGQAGGVVGIPTGIPQLDSVFKLRDQSINLIVGETGNGKTSLALTMAAEQAKLGYSVCFVSLEVPAEMLEAKLVGYHLGISTDEVPKIRPQELESYKFWRKNIQIWSFEHSDLAVEQMQKHLEVFMIEREIRILYVDYLQLMISPGKSREQEVASVSRGLHNLAKKFRVPVVACAQLRRSDPRAEDHRPALDRIRDSGQLEQDASVVIGVYWPHRYNKEENDWGIAEVSVLKNRFGANKVIEATVDWTCGRFFTEVTS